VFALIPPILTELLIRNPEVLRTEIWPVIEFTVQMMSADDWKENDQFARYLSVLFNECDPTDIVDTALQMADRTNRLLPYEVLIDTLFTQRPDLMLPFAVIGRLVGWLARKEALNSEQQRVFKLICERESEKVRKYAVSQRPPVRAQIWHYLQPFLQRTPSPKKSGSPPVVKGDEKRLWAIMKQELKNGKKCDFGLFFGAFQAFPNPITMEFTVQIIDLVGQVRERVIETNRAGFEHMCLTTFHAPQVLDFLEAQWVPAERIVGLSRIVWSAPASLLEGSEQWLPILYGLFLDSVGRVRRNVAMIFRSLIVGMMNEFSVERGDSSLAL
jgi:hypothetical protein